VKSIDLTLVAGSRPELLQRTLESFKKHVFGFIPISQVFVNIDLHGGTESDRNKCIEIILNFFPDARVSTPTVSSFGSAVKHLWSLPQTENFLHLEDDWVAIQDIRIDRLKLPQDARTKQWFLVKPQVSQSILTSYRFRPVRGIPFFLPNPSSPAFTTSPSILNSAFAHRVSRMMKPDLNPEKQMFNGLNPLLEKELNNFRSKALVSWWQKPLIIDIGREWQKARGIQVEIVNGIHGYRNTKKDA
jgi:hypothetical protein